VWDGPTAAESFGATELELVTDTNAPPYTGDGRSLGGTGLLKDQSQCPFRAFAVRRLHAVSPEDGSFGMDPRERGGFVHTALESIWKELKNQHGLKSYLFLESLVEDAVRSAIRNQDSGPLRQQLSLAEIERLTEVILEWLALERERKIPFTVEITEQKRELHLAGLRLGVRIDRIDRLQGGKALLIDYKSGKVSANDLLRDRPKEPQLLAYASSMRDEVDGIFFGQLKPRDIDLIGFAREAQLRGQKNRGGDWYEFMDERLEVVERLAQSFVAGEAAVDPLKEACDFCRVKPFCRISELRASRRGNGDDD
jgi:ATP-dependent helicase/nuclease subunit B